MPRNRRSRRPAMNRPMIGPTERAYGYSRMLGASRTSGSAIGQMRTRSRGGSQTAVDSRAAATAALPTGAAEPELATATRRIHDAGARSPGGVRLHGPGGGPGPAPQARARTRGEAPCRPDRAHRRGARRPRRARASGGRRRRAGRPARAVAEPARAGRDGGVERPTGRAPPAQRDQPPGGPPGPAPAVAPPPGGTAPPGHALPRRRRPDPPP